MPNVSWDDQSKSGFPPMTVITPSPSSFATAKNGHAHAISKGSWTVNRMRLSDPAGGGAVTSGLFSNGTSFKVTFKEQARSQRLSKSSYGRGRRPA